MGATILFPRDYFAANSPNDNFDLEFAAVKASEGLEAALFNFDEFIEDAPLMISNSSGHFPKLLIYRGWMMKPAQYERLYIELVKFGFEPLVKPSDYEMTHCFPNVAKKLEGQTPHYAVFPEERGVVSVDATLVNKTFKRFMVKDYVKSLKNTSFPICIETPVSQGELDSYVEEFIDRRGELFTGGIVLKEFVDLKRYDGVANEWRQFFFDSRSVALARNSQQPESTAMPPEEYLSSRNVLKFPFYTVDYAELENGSWTIIEVGDGQVSGLAESDNPMRFYEALSRVLQSRNI